jgi:glucose/arabinose dehydrogenase
MNRFSVTVLALGLWFGLSWRVEAAHTPIADPLGPIGASNLVVELKPVATGLNAPVHLTHAGDGSGRMFVVDQAGQVRIIQNDVLQPTPFLNVAAAGALGSSSFNVGGERGLLGLAFHPQYNQPGTPGFGKVYTYVSVSLQNGAATDYDEGLANNTALPAAQRTNHQSVIYEWSVSGVNPNAIDTSTRREVMRFDQPQGNHNGGMIEFGSDGYLYIGSGDGGNRDDEDPASNPNSGHSAIGNAQDTNKVLGKILRIDPIAPALKPGSADPISANGKYRNPIDNPFALGGGAPEIFTVGLRNPFRFSFDASSGKMIIPDVGQGAIEEVNVVNTATAAGTNFGWRIREGTFNFDSNGHSANGFIYSEDDEILPPGVSESDLTDPVAQYDHDDGIAVIGGYVYQGLIAQFLQGMYIFGDFSTSGSSPLGRLFAMDMDSFLIRELQIGAGDLPLGLFLKGFGTDEAGNLYVLGGLNNSFTAGGTSGVVLRLIPEPAMGWTMGLSAWMLIQRRRNRNRN